MCNFFTYRRGKLVPLHADQSTLAEGIAMNVYVTHMHTHVGLIHSHLACTCTLGGVAELAVADGLATAIWCLVTGE